MSFDPSNKVEIKQGDSYPIRVRIKLNNEYISSEDLDLLHCVEFMLGDDLRKIYPGEVEFSEGAFYIPLTQDETFNFDENKSVSLDIRIHFTNGHVIGIKKMPKIKVVNAISEVVL